MRTNFMQIIGLIALGAASRLLSHPPNMTAVGAVALKSRERFGLVGLCIPIASMIIGDFVIGFYDWRLLLSVYASFALFGMLGSLLKRTRSLGTIAGTAALGSTLFFLVTNTFVWALSSWYPHDVGGLLACLTAGLPFYRNMLVGDMIATLAIYKLPQLAMQSSLWRYFRKNPLRSALMRSKIAPADPLRLDPDDRRIGIA